MVDSTSHRYTFPIGYNTWALPWRRFPVMSAVDEAGRTIARYRKVRSQHKRSRRVEIVVDAEEELNDELILLLTTTASFLKSFFKRQGGGG